MWESIPGGTNLERGYGDVRSWRPPFTPSCSSQGPFKSQITRPRLRKFGNFSLYSLNFCPNFSLQAPKFGNFQLTSPQIWNLIFSSQAPKFWHFQFTSPPLSEANISSQAPHFGARTPLPEKSWALPPDLQKGNMRCNIIMPPFQIIVLLQDL